MSEVVHKLLLFFRLRVSSYEIKTLLELVKLIFDQRLILQKVTTNSLILYAHYHSSFIDKLGIKLIQKETIISKKEKNTRIDLEFEFRKYFIFVIWKECRLQKITMQYCWDKVL